MTLYIGGGVSVSIDYWRVTGVTRPRHYWPFSQTGDYTDQGSIGGLNLVAGGTGNTFSDGLVVDGSGWANSLGYPSDLCDLGSSFSVLIIIDTTYLDGWKYLTSSNNMTGDAFDILRNGSNGLRVDTWAGAVNAVYDFADFFSGAEVCHIIVTYGGGTYTVYKNGEFFDNHAMAAPGANATLPFTVINSSNSLYPCAAGTRLLAVAVDKDTVWSADDVADIYAAL